MVNIMDGYYITLGIRVVLVELEQWMNGNQFLITTDPDQVRFYKFL